MKRVNSLNDIPLTRQIDGRADVLFYDQSVPVGDFPQKFARAYALKGGEGLKSWEQVGDLLRKLSEECPFLSRNHGTLVALGGGTVCDALGFVASVLERGVRLELIPSTWLCAVDSAHGGKTGINGSGFKNKIGTFYSASEVWLVRDVLESQPPALRESAFAELIKVAWVDGGDWTRDLDRPFWDLLPDAIASKLRVVARDPFEREGDRLLLNLGHTVGHVFEGLLGIDHGSAVGAGLSFAVEWSRYRGFLREESAKALQDQVQRWFLSTTVGVEEFKNCLLQDKKRRSVGASSGHASEREVEVREPFLFEDPSRPLGVRVGLEWVTTTSLIEEGQRQGVFNA